jgi:hypothetical protein
MHHQKFKSETFQTVNKRSASQKVVWQKGKSISEKMLIIVDDKLVFLKT